MGKTKSSTVPLYRSHTLMFVSTKGRRRAQDQSLSRNIRCGCSSHAKEKFGSSDVFCSAKSWNVHSGERNLDVAVFLLTLLSERQPCFTQVSVKAVCLLLVSEIVGIWWRGNEQSKIVDRTAEKTLPVWIFWSESEIHWFDRRSFSGNVR